MKRLVFKIVTSNAIFSKLVLLVTNIIIFIISSLRIYHRKTCTPPKTSSIDLVYTWVDNSDEAWKLKLAKHSGDRNYHSESINKARFRNNNELLYSLRSVFKNANWFNNIYIVTESPPPAWLSCYDDRIRFVRHREIFKSERHLPTFNSHSIESNIHRIAGLSENFIYMNDDFFIGSKVYPTDFFTKDLSKCKYFTSNESTIPTSTSDDTSPPDLAAFNNMLLMKSQYNLDVSDKFLHAPMALKVSTINKLEQQNPTIFEVTSSSKFRSKHDHSIPSSLAHFFGRSIDKSSEGKIKYQYVSFDDPHFELKLNFILLFRHSCFCINDVNITHKNHIKNFKIYHNKMNIMYPEKSPYEK